MKMQAVGVLIVFTLSGCQMPKKTTAPEDPPSAAPAGGVPGAKNGGFLPPPSNLPMSFPDPGVTPFPQTPGPVLSEFRLPTPLLVTDSSEKTLDQVKKSSQPVGMDTRFYFNNLSPSIKEDFSNIHFTIKTDCVLNEQQHFKQEFQKPLKALMPLVELLPQKLLTSFSEEHRAVCSFAFQGKNRIGTMYLFLNLSSLPVSVQEAYQMEVVGPAGKVLDSGFASILFENHPGHWIHLKPHPLPLEVRMVCGKRVWSLKTAANTRFIPLWGFNLTSPDRPPEKGQKTETEEAGPTTPTPGQGGEASLSGYKKCRLLAYDDKQTLKALSLNFELVPELSAPEITLHTLPKRTKHLTSSIRQNMTRDSSQQVPLFLYQYRLMNSQDYPVSVLIAHPENELGDQTKEYVGKFHFLYYDLVEKFGFFKSETMVLYMEELFQRIQAAYPDRDFHLTPEGILFTIAPQTEVHIPVHLNRNFNICRYHYSTNNQRGTKYRTIGGFTYPLPMRFYQLISGEPEALNREENIRKPLPYNTSEILAYPHKNWFYLKSRDDSTKGEQWGQTIALYKNCGHELNLGIQKPLLHIYTDVTSSHVRDMTFRLIEHEDPFFFSGVNQKENKLKSLNLLLEKIQSE